MSRSSSSVPLPRSRTIDGLEGFGNITVRPAISATDRAQVRQLLTRGYAVLASPGTSIDDLERDLYPEVPQPGMNEFTSVAFEGEEILGTSSMHWSTFSDPNAPPVDALTRFRHPCTWDAHFGCSVKLVGEMGRLAMCERMQRPEHRSAEVAIYRELVQLLKEQAELVGLTRLISIMPRSTRRLTFATGHRFWPIEECGLALEEPGNQALFTKYRRYWLPERAGLAPVLFQFETLADADHARAVACAAARPGQQSTDVRLLGLAHVLPTKVVTNDFFVASGEVNEQWIVERTGVQTRHWVDDHEYASTLGQRAAADALRAAGLKATDVDVLICTTVTPEQPLPSTACLIQAKIGAAKAAAFDVSAACSGFVYGSWLAQQILVADPAKIVLLVSVDVLSPFVRHSSVRTAVLFGDGAAAAVFGRGRQGMRLLDIAIGSDGSKGHLLTIPAGGSRLPASAATIERGLHSVQMEGPALFKLAVEQMTSASSDLLVRCGLEAKDVGLLVAHQANRRIIEAVAQRLQLDPKRVFVNIDQVGNTASASIPIALDRALAQGLAKQGDLVLLAAFGGGVTWGCALMEVCREPIAGHEALLTDRQIGTTGPYVTTLE